MAGGPRAHELLEREDELEAISRRITEARAGSGGLLVIEGAAGVGKSALLRELSLLAQEAGVSTLTAVGGELERDFPFGMVRQLLEPVVLAAPPERRDQLLSGASTAAAPIVGGARAEPSADAGFATLHGLYWLVAALADEEPLVLVYDDAHWSDAPSLRFLDFLARRVRDLPVLIAVGARPNEPGSEQQLALLDGLGRMADGGVVRPGLLSATGVRELMRTGGHEVADAAHAATGGNPLLLRELIRTLDAHPGSLTAETVREAVPSSVTRSVQHRLAALPDTAGAVAVALAVLGERTDPGVVGQVAEVDHANLTDALDTLRAADLIAGEPASYVHPLLRQAVAESAPRTERDALHLRAAEILRDEPAAQNQMLSHLLAAPPLDQDWARAALRSGALRAMAEGAPDVAVTRLERAVESTQGPADPALLLELGQATLQAGDPVAAFVHLEAAERSPDPIASATAVSVRVGAEILRHEGLNEKAGDDLERALDALPPDAPTAFVDGLRGNLLSTLALDSRMAGRRRRLLDDDRASNAPGRLAHQAWELACGDAPATEVIETARRALGHKPFATVNAIEQGTGIWASVSCHAVDGRDVADAALSAADETARRHGSRIGRGQVATQRGEFELTFGSAARAEANSHQALAIWEEAGLAIMETTARAGLAEALVRLGRVQEADEVLVRASTEEHTYTSALTWQSRALVRMAQGRAEEAVEDLMRAQALCERSGWRRFAHGYFGPQLAGALAAAGRKEEGERVAREELELARRTGRASLELAATIELGVMLGGEPGLAELAAAMEAAPRSQSPYLRARAAVEYGSAIRRSGNRADAREHLRKGGELAGRCAATALERRALDELSVAGGRKRDPFSSGVDSLTPSERRVADHAARGLTNREIAETLFVTQKTVEVHLGKTYAKLEIRSRNQLASALGKGIDE